MHILLLGSSGRLGTAMQRLWGERHTLSTPGRKLNLLNPEQTNTYLEQTKPDLVINTIAYNDVDRAEGEGLNMAFQLNVELPGILAKVCAKRSLPLIHLSTNYVFDGEREAGYQETDLPTPTSIYGLTKYLGEQAVQLSHPNSYIVRTARLYGPKAQSENAKKSFIDLIVRDAEKDEHFLVNRSEVSAPTFVDDLVLHIEQHLFSLPTPGIYHISNAGAATWFEWASEIIRILKLPVTIDPRDPATLNRAAPRPSYTVLHTTKLPPLRPWQEALEAFLLSQSIPFNPVWQR